MKLFELKDHQVEFSPQALLLEPFKKIWDRDKTKDKFRAINELAFVWYMEDVRSDFYDIIDIKERKKEVLKFLPELGQKFEIDEIIKDASTFYREMSETISVKLLKDTMQMITNLREAMRKVDFQERDKSGKLVFDYGKAVDLSTKIPTLIRSLKETYREIEREADEDHLMRGGRLKSTFEDGI